jgi:ABC-type Mn2+/Zn2+ transport system ATPase subunit
MSSPSSRRLAQFSVTNLFGEYNHHVTVNTKDNITAIIAPNGVGKTVCLKLINAFFNKSWSIFLTTKFDQIKMFFTDGYRVEISVEDRPVAAVGGRQKQTEKNLKIWYGECDGKLQVWSPIKDNGELTGFSADRLERLDRYVPFVTRLGPNEWLNEIDGAISSAREVLEKFRDRFPATLLSDLLNTENNALSDILQAIPCRLIETQRLIVFPEEEERYIGPNRLRARPSILAINRKARTLSDIITKELQNYANLSQSLDRSFPRRVLDRQFALQGEAGGPARSRVANAQPDLREELQSLEQRRQTLIELGILDASTTEAVNLPSDDIPENVRPFLQIYVQDAKAKLDSLRQIEQKVSLFCKLLKKRFVDKDIVIKKDIGFFVLRRGQSISLERLSSGEQHQIILLFELLFETRENSLILIDEPELSLHVAWQKMFMPDLKEIIALNNFDVILATHSPYLIGEWIESIVELSDKSIY